MIVLLSDSLFTDSADVYSPFVLVRLICITAGMTISVFYLDLVAVGINMSFEFSTDWKYPLQQWHHVDFTMTNVVTATSITISTLLLYCYFGKLATESYEMMSECVYKMDWYKLSNELQKYFISMIANMQRPIYYHGFYVANLDLTTFIKVIGPISNCIFCNILHKELILYILRCVIRYARITWCSKLVRRNRFMTWTGQTSWVNKVITECVSDIRPMIASKFVVQPPWVGFCAFYTLWHKCCAFFASFSS